MKQIVILPIVIISLCFFPSLCLTAPEENLPDRVGQDQAAYEKLNDLIRQIRDGQIERVTAQKNMIQLLAEARNIFYLSGGTDITPLGWYFPVAGLDIRSIQRGRKHGFIDRGYDFYAGNRHKAHPSLDIFIRDRNHDGLNVKSGEPMQVISMTAGIVIAIENYWEPGSNLRGGKYLWVYDPGNDLLIYYAHNERLYVTVGNMVKPGDSLATVGRSGYNAAKLRSPTHLHLTVLMINKGRMTPLNVYHNLIKAKVISNR